MQLIDFLKTADKGEYIYLGAASCFVWIAKPDEMIAKLPELDADHTDRLKLQIKRKYNVIPYLERTASTNIERERLERLRSIKDEQERELENRIPFAARQVKDVYRRKLVEPFGIVVIIEGNEMGDFWSYEDVEDYNGQV